MNYGFNFFLKVCLHLPGKRAGKQKFYSPKKNGLKVKGCVLIRRALLNKEILDVLDKGSMRNI